MRNNGNDIAPLSAALVASGEGVAGFCATRGADIELRPLAGNPLSRELVLMWRRNSPLAAQISALRDGVRAGYCAHLRDRLGMDAWLKRGGESFILDAARRNTSGPQRAPGLRQGVPRA
ncbi:hypothetical protein [Streptomyces melanogenes]|uniref:hypothetical protein n=1 Tax=Streptomyces melanogenes TaxID=67326 RepID=UPI00167E5BFD|nr:hypothetical protein [Streptomyces melanogenes]GGP86791.1 hypothetical protein GCM10010278_76700 [Streptomyces melanogenes]